MALVVLEQQEGWLVGWFIGCFVGWLVYWLIGWLVYLLVGWLVYLLVGWLVGWFIGWLVGWLVGRFVGTYSYERGNECLSIIALLLLMCSYSNIGLFVPASLSIESIIVQGS